MSTNSLQDVASTGHDSLFFQLYVIRNRGMVEAVVRRAEQLRFKALVITVDAQRLGKREADERNRRVDEADLASVDCVGSPPLRRFTLPPGLNLEILEEMRRSTASPLDAVSGSIRDVKEGSGLSSLFAKEVKP